jgi:ArpU family phage transcriptional regulator
MDRTRRNVEERLEAARIYKNLGHFRREAKTTASPEPRYHGSTNTVSNQTEDIALFNTMQEERMRSAYEEIERILKHIPSKQREIIQMRYLDNLEEDYDYVVCQQVHLSDRTYRRFKSKAIINLAFALRLEVWINPEEKNVTVKCAENG